MVYIISELRHLSTIKKEVTQTVEKSVHEIQLFECSDKLYTNVDIRYVQYPTQLQHNTTTTTTQHNYMPHYKIVNNHRLVKHAGIFFAGKHRDIELNI